MSSTVVLKRQKRNAGCASGFREWLNKSCLVDSRAYVSVITQKESDRIKQQASAKIFKRDDLSICQTQVADSQLEKPLATATLKFDFGDETFAAHFVVMQKLTRQIVRL